MSYPIRCIIPTHNRPGRMKSLLVSLLKVKAAGKELPSVIDIVENGSHVTEELTRKYADQLPLRYTHFSDGNKSAALNSMVNRLSKLELIVFLDDDIQIVDTGIFERYRLAAENFGDHCFFGGEVIPDYEVTPDAELVKYMPVSNTGLRFEGSAFILHDKANFLGANWAAYSSRLLEVGGFNAAFGPGAASGSRGQETDAQVRLLAAGGQPVAIPNSRVAHYVPAKAVTKDWVLERRRLAARWYGAKFGSPVKMIYWRIRMLSEWCFSFRLSSAVRYARYRGFVEGYRGRKKNDKA